MKPEPYKIEKGIPIPPARKPSPARLAVSQLRPGDSFLCPHTAYSRVRHSAEMAGFKITTRTEGNYRRVWRLKK